MKSIYSLICLGFILILSGCATSFKVMDDVPSGKPGEQGYVMFAIPKEDMRGQNIVLSKRMLKKKDLSGIKLYCSSKNRSKNRSCFTLSKAPGYYVLTMPDGKQEGVKVYPDFVTLVKIIPKITSNWERNMHDALFQKVYVKLGYIIVEDPIYVEDFGKGLKEDQLKKYGKGYFLIDWE